MDLIELAYKRLIDKFVAAYSIIGIYIHDAGRIIALNQKNPKGIMILRENANKLSREGHHIIKFQNFDYGIVINQTEAKSQLIMLTEASNLDAMANHWKRVLPAVLKTLPIDQIVEEESPSTKLARLSSQINELMDEIITEYSNQSN